MALSSLSAQVPDAYCLADRFRARGVPVVMGGLHATALPEEAAAPAPTPASDLFAQPLPRWPSRPVRPIIVENPFPQ